MQISSHTNTILVGRSARPKRSCDPRDRYGYATQKWQVPAPSHANTLSLSLPVALPVGSAPGEKRERPIESESGPAKKRSKTEVEDVGEDIESDVLVGWRNCTADIRDVSVRERIMERISEEYGFKISFRDLKAISYTTIGMRNPDPTQTAYWQELLGSAKSTPESSSKMVSVQTWSKIYSILTVIQSTVSLELEAPADKTAAVKAPTDQALVHQALAQEAPQIDKAPAGKAPSDQALVHQATVQEATVQEAPADKAAASDLPNGTYQPTSHESNTLHKV